MERRKLLGGLGLLSLSAITARAQLPAAYGVSATTSGDNIDLTAETQIGPGGANDLTIINTSGSANDLIGEVWQCNDTATAVSSSAAGIRIPPGSSLSISRGSRISPDERICSFTVAVPSGGSATFDWLAQ